MVNPMSAEQVRKMPVGVPLARLLARRVVMCQRRATLSGAPCESGRETRDPSPATPSRMDR
jgi:hypothetical protein